MRFLKGGRYRHKHCLDVDMLICYVQYITANRVVIKVLYVNRNYQGGNMIIEPHPERIDFTPDMQLWSKVY